MNVLTKACVYQLNFYKTLVFVYGTFAYALEKHCYYEQLGCLKQHSPL